MEYQHRYEPDESALVPETNRSHPDPASVFIEPETSPPPESTEPLTITDEEVLSIPVKVVDDGFINDGGKELRDSLMAEEDHAPPRELVRDISTAPEPVSSAIPERTMVPYKSGNFALALAHFVMFMVAATTMIGFLGLEQQVILVDNKTEVEISFSFVQAINKLELLRSALFAQIGGR